VTAKPGHKSAIVHWTAPANNGGAPVTRYTITPYKHGQPQTKRSFTGTSTTDTVTGLATGQYTFKVTATNARGTSLPSGASGTINIA
jgi:hypothetical protein